IDAVLRGHADHVALTSANPFYSFQEIELDDRDVRLLAEGERGITIRSLLGRSEEARRTAYALLETGLLELRDGAAVRSGGPAPRVRLHDPGAARPRTNAQPAPSASTHGVRPAAPAAAAARPATATAAKPAAVVQRAAAGGSRADAIVQRAAQV